MTITSVAFKNLRRKPMRTWLLLVILALITSTLLTGFLCFRSAGHALGTGASRLGADILVVPEDAVTQARSVLLSGEPTHFLMPAKVLDRIRSVKGVRTATPQLFIKPSGYTCCYNIDVFLIAFDPKTDITVTPWLSKNLKREPGATEIIAGSEVPVAVGDIIPFYGTDFTVAGIMDPTGMGFLDRSVFMSLDAGYRMAEDSKVKARQPLELGRDRISAVLVRVEDNTTPERAAIEIEHEITGVKAVTTDAVISAVVRQLTGIRRVLLLIGSLLAVVLLFIVSFAFTVIVNERRRELGLLRAMGATKCQAARLIVMEATMLSSAGGGIGIVAGLVMLPVLKGLLLGMLKVPYLLPPLPELVLTVTAAVVLSAFAGILASLLPVSSATRQEPFESIRSSV